MSEISQNVDHALTVHNEAVKLVQFTIGKLDNASIRADEAGLRTYQAQESHLATQQQRLLEERSHHDEITRLRESHASELAQRDKAHQNELARKQELFDRQFNEQVKSGDRRFNSFRNGVGYVSIVMIILVSLISFFAWQANSKLTQANLDLYNAHATATAQANQINDLKAHQRWNTPLPGITNNLTAPDRFSGAVPEGKTLLMVVYGVSGYYVPPASSITYKLSGSPSFLSFSEGTYVHIDSIWGWGNSGAYINNGDRTNYYCTANQKASNPGFVRTSTLTPDQIPNCN